MNLRFHLDAILNAAFQDIYPELHPDMRNDILSQTLAGRNAAAEFAETPHDAATLSFMEWVQLVSVGAQLAALVLDRYDALRKAGEAADKAKTDSVSMIKQQASLEQLNDPQVFITAVEEELNKIE